MLSYNQEAERWPLPKFDQNDEPHFLFIISPPNSGSTAISQIINTSDRAMTLTPKAEGQWLIPGLCEKDRWDSEKKVNYQSVKATWLSQYQKAKSVTQNIDVVIEKSPPNMMRMVDISSQFKRYSFIANNRDPYASCSSILYRYHNVHNLTTNQRREIISKIAGKWVTRSLKIKGLIESLDIPLLTYENFCDDPSTIKNILDLPIGVSDSINQCATVKVKDYKPQQISNQNERQISKITRQEIEKVGKVIEENIPLLNFFGYKLLD